MLSTMSSIEDGEEDNLSSGGGKTAPSGSKAHEVTLSRVYFNRALVEVHLGDDEAALADLDLALKHNPKDKAARGARAVILRRMGKWHDSQREYLKLDQQREDEIRKKKANSLKLAQREAKGKERSAAAKKQQGR
jgi:tetratricopeptide (TPR) repeat protein